MKEMCTLNTYLPNEETCILSMDLEHINDTLRTTESRWILLGNFSTR